jgi:hypothetical protein
MHEMSPLCVLDFYIHHSYQRWTSSICNNPIILMYMEEREKKSCTDRPASHAF